MGAFNPMDMFNAGGQLGQASASPFTYGSQNVMDQFKMGQQLKMQLAGQLGLKDAENQLPLNPTTQAKEVSETNKNNAISSQYIDSKNNGTPPPILDSNGNPIGNFGGGLKRDLLQAQVTNTQDKRWDKIGENSDPSKARGSTTLGMASNANLRAQRAKVTLSNPMVTNEDAHNIFSDLAGIYAGGSPTDIGMQGGSYDSIAQKATGMLQYFSGDPKGVLTPEMKQHVAGVIDDLKNTNDDLINRHFDYQEKMNPDVIDAHREQWNAMRASALGKQNQNSFVNQALGGNQSSGKTGGTGKFKLMRDKSGNTAKVYDDGTIEEVSQ